MTAVFVTIVLLLMVHITMQERRIDAAELELKSVAERMKLLECRMGVVSGAQVAAAKSRMSLSTPSQGTLTAEAK